MICLLLFLVWAWFGVLVDWYLVVVGVFVVLCFYVALLLIVRVDFDLLIVLDIVTRSGVSLVVVVCLDFPSGLFGIVHCCMV